MEILFSPLFLLIWLKFLVISIRLLLMKLSTKPKYEYTSHYHGFFHGDGNHKRRGAVFLS